MKYVYKAWCEWDCGADDVVFGSKQEALEWLSKSALIGTDIDTTIESLLSDGLVGVDRVEFIGYLV